mmetsp:Transcript_121110/g.387793  ORF Transcript_121110/g.387793 Transcript_121110/m.387793 type:complete len:843 (+) Transcript_121110:2442-4970(+)
MGACPATERCSTTPFRASTCRKVPHTVLARASGRGRGPCRRCQFPFFENIEDFGNASSHNLVTYAYAMLFFLFVPLLGVAAVGDFNLALDSIDEEDNAARLLPWALDDGAYLGARSLACAKLSYFPLMLRSTLVQELLTALCLLFAFCRREGRAFRTPEVLELPQRREVALVEHFRRLAMRGARVAPGDIDVGEPKKGQKPKWGWRRKTALPLTPQNSKSNVKNARGNIQETTMYPTLEDNDGSRPALKDLMRLGLEDYDRQKAGRGRQDDKRSAEEWGQDVRSQIDQVNRADDPPHELNQPSTSGYHTPPPAAYAATYAAAAAAPPVQVGPPPEGWIAKRADEFGGRYYWINLLNGKSTWSQPTLAAVKEMSVPEMRALLGARADQVHLRAELEDLLRTRIAERMQELQADEEPMEVSSIRSPTPPPSWQPGSMVGGDFAMPSGGARRNLRADGLHRAAPPAALPSTSGPPSALKPAWDGGEAVELRGAGQGEDAPQASAAPKTEAGRAGPPPGRPPPAGKAGNPEDVPLRFRLQFLDYSAFRVLWLCWLRTFPLVAVLAPQMVRPRVARAAALLLRLSCALALATGAAQLGLVPSADEDVKADKRGLGDLFKEMDVAMGHPDTFPFGLCCALGASLLTALLTPAAVLWRKAQPGVGAGLPEKIEWWRKQRRRLYLGGLLAVLLSAGLAGAAGGISKNTPQPRASVATGLFVVAVLVDLALLPLLSTLLQAAIVGLAGRPRGRCSCFGPLADALASQLPSLLDFRLAQVQNWTSSELLLPRLRAIVEEQRLADALAAGEPAPPLLGVKAKRMEDASGPQGAAKPGRPGPGAGVSVSKKPFA